MQRDVVADLSDEIGIVLETYAKHGAADGGQLPLSSPFFDTALSRLAWRIARTLGRDTDRFYALLRDAATRTLNGARRSLFYLVVAGEAVDVQGFLRDGAGVRAACEEMRRREIVGRGTRLRLASYTLGLDDVIAMTPGQIGRIGQQFYDPTAGFREFVGQVLLPSTTRFTLRVLVGHRERNAATEEDWFDGICDPYAEAQWESAARRGRLSVQACRTWSDLALTVAAREVENRLRNDANATTDWAQARLEGFIPYGRDAIEISLFQESESLGPVEIPLRLIRHNPYGFHQLLLQIAPLHMEGEAIC